MYKSLQIYVKFERVTFEVEILERTFGYLLTMFTLFWQDKLFYLC